MTDNQIDQLKLAEKFCSLYKELGLQKYVAQNIKDSSENKDTVS